MFAVRSAKRLHNIPEDHGRYNTTSPNHQEINNYRFVDCIGRGNFGDVYKAYDLRQQKNVAIKAINIEHSDDEIPVLLQEINLLRSLRHPNITNWYKTFIIDVTMFIVMEYCSEGSCSDLLKFNRNGLEECVLSYIMKNVLEGLKYLHSLNIIHRDIKAANILIAKGNVIKLADFGVSGELNGNTGRKTFVGTPYWMAPEIVTDCKSLKKDRENLERRLIENGLGKRTLYKLWKKKIQQDTINENYKTLNQSKSEKVGPAKTDNELVDDLDDVEYDEKVDIWSLGITLIELGTGKVPNNDKEPLKALFEIPKMEPPRLPKNSSYYMKEFGVACLCKDPVMRPSAAELLKFKFINKNKLKANALSVLSGHSNKIKKKRPKFELNMESVNYGPELDWDLSVDNPDKGVSFYKQPNVNIDAASSEASSLVSSEVESFKGEGVDRHTEEEDVDAHADAEDEDEDSSDEEENTFANSFFGNNPPPARQTADTSPLVGGNGVDRHEDDFYYEGSVHGISSEKIRDIIKTAGEHLYKAHDNAAFKSVGEAHGAPELLLKQTLACLGLLQKALVDLRHCNESVAGEICRRLGEASAL